MNAGPIHDGIEAVSCSCTPVAFSGVWDVESIDVADISAITECFNTSCSNESNGVLSSQSLVCIGTVNTLITYQANLTFTVSSEGCVKVNVSIVPGRVYSHATDSPLSLSFLRTNYYLVENNSFAVVTNHKGVIVGQIQSDMIQIEYSNLSNVSSVSISVAPCILFDKSMGVSGDYDVFDVGILQSDGKTVYPLGLTEIFNFTTNENLKMCFSEVNLTDVSTSLILIKRDLAFETASANSHAEESIVLTSGILFCIGALLVFVFNIFIPFNMAVLSVGAQSFCFLLVRSIYFFLLYNRDIVIGGLLDFALVEIPTFIYIGIFLEIILVAYWLFFRSDEVASSMLLLEVVSALVINWSTFAAIIIILDETQSPSKLEKYCNCQISDPVVESKTAEIIRITYKSVVLGIAIIVTFVTIIYGGKHVMSRNKTVYYEVVFLSVGLLCDCVAFLIYYIVNTPSAYFLLALWFTELLPIIAVNGMVSSTYILYWIDKGKGSYDWKRNQARSF